MAQALVNILKVIGHICAEVWKLLLPGRVWNMISSRQTNEKNMV